MAMLSHPAVLLFLTVTVYWMTNIVRARTGSILCNPVVLSSTSMIVYLKVFGIDYATYYEAGQMIDFWLKPAVVSLAVPLYLNWEKNLQPMVADYCLTRRGQHYRYCQRRVHCQVDGRGS